jgi:hypothetical protein
MALWYDCGNGFTKTKWAKADMGCDAYLFCPGPSLKDVDNVLLNTPGVMSFAINTAYPKIRPDVWIGMDRPECYNYKLWWESFPKIIRGGYQDMKCEGHPVKKLPNVFAADVESVDSYSELFKRRAHDVKFVWHKNTLAIALHIMVWMGAKKIHFVGCDFNGVHYYDGRGTPLAHREANERLYTQQVDYLKWFQREGKKHGITTISCTHGSPINKFMDYIPLRYAVANSARVPLGLPESKLLHAVDAEELYKEEIYDTLFNSEEEPLTGESKIVIHDKNDLHIDVETETDLFDNSETPL